MTKGRVLFASLIGTTIEFFDFYIYGTAASSCFRSCSSAATRRLRHCNRSRRSRSRSSRDRGVGAVRSLRRPDRPQGDARRGVLTMGGVDGRHRSAADYTHNRHRRAGLLALCRSVKGSARGEWGGGRVARHENAPRGKESCTECSRN